MPEPTVGAVHVNSALSNLVMGWQQKFSKFIATQVFPIVRSEKQSDTYFEYDRGEWLSDEAQYRASAAESAGTTFSVSAEQTFKCLPVSMHRDLPWDVLKNQDKALNLVRTSVNWTTMKVLRKLDIEFRDNYFTTGKWGRDITGASAVGTNQIIQWDRTSSTPVEDVEELCVYVEGETGFRPNTMVISPTVLGVLKRHTDVKDYYKYTRPGLITPELIAQVFELDRILVAGAVVNSAGRGAAVDAGFIFGNHALLLYVPPTPVPEEPSAGFTFMWTQQGFDVAVNQIPIDLKKADRVEAEIYIDHVLASNVLGVFINNALSTSYPNS